MMVSVVVVGLVPYFTMNPDTPISSAFARNDVHWAVYIITSGACHALCSALMGSILPQPRILMAMARDGLLPSFFSDVNERTQVPVEHNCNWDFCSIACILYGLFTTSWNGQCWHTSCIHHSCSFNLDTEICSTK